MRRLPRSVPLAVVLAVVATCLHPAADAALPPGYQDVMWCPEGYCDRSVDLPCCGPTSRYHECYDPASGSVVDEAWTGARSDVVPPAGWVRNPRPCRDDDGGGGDDAATGAGDGGDACRDDADCAGGRFCMRPAGRCDGVGKWAVKAEACFEIYDPVCGCDGATTYDNACKAAAAGASVRSEGECPASAENTEILVEGSLYDLVACRSCPPGTRRSKEVATNTMPGTTEWHSTA